jgi:hypothetical protein
MKLPLVTLLLLACDKPPEAPRPYEAIVLQPFSVQEAERMCPQGFDVVHKEYCNANRDLSSAVIVCRGHR